MILIFDIVQSLSAESSVENAQVGVDKAAITNSPT
jgi:hypothetical protein